MRLSHWVLNKSAIYSIIVDRRNFPMPDYDTIPRHQMIDFSIFQYDGANAPFITWTASLPRDNYGSGNVSKSLLFIIIKIIISDIFINIWFMKQY